MINQIKRSKKYINTKTILFVSVFLMYFVFSMYIDITDLYFDSSVYWDLAKDIIDGCLLDFSKYPANLRGYFYPTILIILKNIGMMFNNEFLFFRLLISVIIALVFSVFLPSLFEVHLDDNKNIFFIFLSSIVFLLYYGENIYYPLSDFPAFSFFLIYLYFFKKSFTSSNNKLLFLSGMFSYFAYSTRLVYLYSSIISLLLLLIINKLPIKQCILVCIHLTLGFLFASIPQIIANKANLNVISPLIVSTNYNGSDIGLSQLFWGLSMPRYETYVGNNYIYPSAGVEFYDFRAINLLNADSITIENISLFKYIIFLLKHPFFTCSFFIKHFISVLTPVFNSVYINNIFDISYFKLILHIVLCAYFLIFSIVNFINKKIDFNSIYMFLCMAITSMIQMIGAVEPRFGIPFLVPMYFLVVRQIYDNLSSDKHKTIYAYILIVLISIIWFIIIKNIINSNEIGLIIIGN